MIGESESEIFNRRQQVHRFREEDNGYSLQDIELTPNDDLPLLEQQKQNIQPQTCFSRFFGQQQKPTPEEHQIEDQEHEKYDDAWFEQFNKTPDSNVPDTDVIIHQITPDDSIEGLELQYGVPASKIRNYNQLHTNDIYYLKFIKIPNPQSDFQSQHKFDWPTYLKELKVSEFVNKICKPEDKSAKVANYYLQIAEWDMLLAIKEYESDYAYEQKERQKSSKIPKHKVNI